MARGKKIDARVKCWLCGRKKPLDDIKPNSNPPVCKACGKRKTEKDKW